MAAENLYQVYQANPITSNDDTDLMYFGLSPYGVGNDAGMLFSDFKAQFVLSNATLAINKGGTGQTTAPNAFAALGNGNAANSLWSYQTVIGAANLVPTRSNGFLNCTSSGFNISDALGLASYANGYYFCIKNATNSGNVTFVPFGAETIDGNSSLVVAPQQSVIIVKSAGQWSSVAESNFSSGNVNAGTTGQLAYYAANGTTLSGLTVSSTPTASKIALWDANVNLSANNFIEGYATTATAAATTTLTVGSAYQQYFTGTTTQNCKLPVTSTLALGQGFYIVNNSTGVVTVQSSGSNTVKAMAAGSALFVRCISTSGTTAASWDATGYVAASSPSPWTAGAGTGSAIGGDGTSTASGNYSLSYGVNNSVIGNNSIAVGQNFSINGNYTAGFGYGNTSFGNYGLMAGYQCSVGGDYSFAAGYQANAQYRYCFAFGNTCSANATGTYAIGYNSTAYYQGSVVWQDSSNFNNTDSANNQWVNSFAGGYFWYVGNGSTKLALTIDTTGAVAARGTSTNNNAPAGYIGEFISANTASGSAVSLTSDASANIASISLTAGDWDVQGFIATSVGAGTTTVNLAAGISKTSATLPTPDPTASYWGFSISNPSAGNVYSEGLSTCRISLASTTTVYLVCQATFAVSTESAYGWISARRRR